MNYRIMVDRVCQITSTELAEAEEFARKFVDNSHSIEVVYVVDDDDRIIFEYGRARTLFEVTFAEIVGGRDSGHGRVIWVEAACAQEIAEWAAGAAVTSILPMHEGGIVPWMEYPTDVAFVLPAEGEAFSAHCRKYAVCAGQP